MQEHGGVIINIASIGGLRAEPSIGIYNGTKAAVMHLTRTLGGRALARRGCSASLPGW